MLDTVFRFSCCLSMLCDKNTPAKHVEVLLEVGSKALAKCEAGGAGGVCAAA